MTPKFDDDLPLDVQLEELAKFLLQHHPNAISGGAIETALRVMAADLQEKHKPRDDANYKYEASKLRREMVEMGGRASSEIKMLRRRIDQLAPKADAYERLSQMLDLLPKRSRGEGEDVAWMLDKRIGELKKEMAE